MKKARRRERERLAKRQEILKAAREVFAAKGLHAATLEEIAVRAEFAKGTLYCYFKNKDDLFLSMLIEEITGLCRDLKSVAALPIPPPRRLEEMVRTMLRLFEENVDLMKLMVRERPGMIADKRQGRVEKRLQPLFQELVEVVGGMIEEGVKQGFFRKVDVKRTAIVFFNLVHGSAMNSLWKRQRIADESEVSYLTDVLLHGIESRTG